MEQFSPDIYLLINKYNDVVCVYHHIYDNILCYYYGDILVMVFISQYILILFSHAVCVLSYTVIHLAIFEFKCMHVVFEYKCMHFSTNQNIFGAIFWCRFSPLSACTYMRGDTVFIIDINYVTMTENTSVCSF